jgi:hypothetical protein
LATRRRDLRALPGLTARRSNRLPPAGIDVKRAYILLCFIFSAWNSQ